MEGEHGEDCHLLALTALLHAAHEGPTASRPRDTLVSVCMWVCKREKQRMKGHTLVKKTALVK